MLDLGDPIVIPASAIHMLVGSHPMCGIPWDDVVVTSAAASVTCPACVADALEQAAAHGVDI